MAYTEEFKANALIQLAANGGDLDTTAEALGISTSTLWRWAKGQQVKKKSKKKDSISKNETESNEPFRVEDGIEAAIKHLISNIPVMRGDEWGVALGILLDKWLILQNQPTERIESLFGQLGGLSPEAYEDVLAEAERILGGSGSPD